MLDDGRKRHNMCYTYAGQNVDWESVAWEIYDALENITWSARTSWEEAIEKYSDSRTRKGKDRRG